MIIFNYYLTSMDSVSSTSTDDTAGLIEETTQEVYGNQPEEQQKSKTIFLLYFVPTVFFVFGIVVFLGALVQIIKSKWFPDTVDVEEENLYFRDYGTCRGRKIELHNLPSTSLNEGGSTIDQEALSKELEKRLEGDTAQGHLSSKKSRKVKKIRNAKIVSIV